jgi:hypothetical protein
MIDEAGSTIAPLPDASAGSVMDVATQTIRRYFLGRRRNHLVNGTLSDRLYFTHEIKQ